jgi:hypothetical protein
MTIPNLPTSLFTHPVPSDFADMIQGIDTSFNMTQFFSSLRHVKVRRLGEQHFIAFRSDVGPRAFRFTSVAAHGFIEQSSDKFALEICPLKGVSGLAVGIVADLMLVQQKAIDDASGAGRGRRIEVMDIKLRFLTMFRETWLDCVSDSYRFCSQAANQLGRCAEAVVDGQPIDGVAVKLVQWLEQHEFECAPPDEILRRIHGEI